MPHRQRHLQATLQGTSAQDLCFHDPYAFSQFSFALLSLASLLTTLKENFGDPIDCIVDKEVPKSVFKVFHKLQTSGQRNTRFVDILFENPLILLETNCYEHSILRLIVGSMAPSRFPLR